MEQNKAVLIGLDGATFNILGPLVASGSMPNLKSIMDNGCWGDLISTTPPITVPAWATLMTGKLPGKIGLFGFQNFSTGSYNPPFATAADIKSKMFWELASDAGKKVFIINFPLTYPIRKINGGIVSGFLTPANAADYYHPESLKDDIEGFPLYNEKLSKHKGDLDVFLKKVMDALERRYAVIEKVAQKERWDLFMFCLMEPDLTNHFLAKYLFSTFPEYSTQEGENIRGFISKLYRKIDDLIGVIMKAFGDSATYMVVSDHGSGPTPKYSFNVNKLLASKGIFKSNLKSPARIIYKNGPKLVSEWVKKIFPNKVDIADYSETLAWGFSYRCRAAFVFINLKGRNPYGIIEPGAEYEKLLERIMRILDNVRHDGVKVVDRIYKRDEIYDGPYTSQGPDLVFTMHPDYDVPNSNKVRNDLKAASVITPDRLLKNFSGNHEYRGIYALSGPDIRKLGKYADSKIESVAPTMLYAIGLPIPDDLDGSIMENVFSDACMRRRPPSFHSVEDYVGEGLALDEVEEDMHRQQLENLGYL